VQEQADETLPAGTYHYRIVAEYHTAAAPYSQTVDVYGADASFTIGSGGGNNNITTGSGTGSGAEKVKLAGGTKFRAKNNAVTVPLSCPTSNKTKCQGQVSLSTIKGTTAAKKKAKRTGIGSATFNVQRGKTGSIKLKLNAAGRRLFSRHGSIKATLKVASFGGSQLASRKITISH
jgi:hypothetical protein